MNQQSLAQHDLTVILHCSMHVPMLIFLAKKHNGLKPCWLPVHVWKQVPRKRLASWLDLSLEINNVNCSANKTHDTQMQCKEKMQLTNKINKHLCNIECQTIEEHTECSGVNDTMMVQHIQ